MTAIQIQGNGRQVVGNHAPTNPTLHARQATIQAASQMPRAPQLTDAPLDAIPKTQGRSKPGLTFFAFASCGFVSRLRQAHLPHPKARA